jgi:hypothetical protein
MAEGRRQGQGREGNGALLFGKKNEQKTVSKKQKQLDSRFEEIAGDIQVAIR